MYDLSGIFYRIKSVGGIVFIIAGIELICSRFWNKEKRHKKMAVVGAIGVAFALVYSIVLWYGAINLEVGIHEGYISRIYRDSRVAPPLPFTMGYVFTNDEGLKPTFYLDIGSKKTIYNKEFDEKRTNIIVKVEELQS